MKQLIPLSIALIIMASGCDETSNDNNSARGASQPAKITFSEAKEFMQNRCNAVNQQLMRSKTVDFQGTTCFMFLSVAENGLVCTSLVSEHALDVVASDCGSVDRKMQEWNAVN